ncbi:MAG TPA: alpha/beta fold hydrolase [Gemmatimonadales bacterium]|nr:alpha/beta fold hydrolase [Gemmatimonadales bacterium]
MFDASPLSPLEMSVPAADGLVLKGILRYPQAPLGARYPLAVLAHQYPATGDSFAPLVIDLLALGVATLAFDLRGHGSSIQSPDGPRVIDTPAGFTLEDFGTAFMSSARRLDFARIEDDILRVAAWGAAQNYVDPERIALVGASVGGSGVLLAAPSVTGLRAVVTFGAAGAPVFPDGPARIRASVERLRTVPFLLTSSEQDAFDGAANVRAWSDGLAHASPRIVPGSAHAMAIYYEVRDEVVPMLTRALGVERRRG